jgi:hypothetical protein
VVNSPARLEFEGLSLLREDVTERVRVAGTIQFGGTLHAARLGPIKWIRSARGEAGFDLERDAQERYAIREDPTGGRLQAALDQYLASADHGWHLRVHAMDGPPVTCRAVVRTGARIARADRHFSQIWGADGASVKFDEFELSADGKELRVDVTVTKSRGEIVFETEPATATVAMEVTVQCDDPAAGVWGGEGTPLPQEKPVELQRDDPRLRGFPRGYPQVPPGLFVRAVDPPGVATLPEATQERLRALGYLD